MSNSSSPYREALLAAGHQVHELSPAFPDLTSNQIEQIVVDTARCLNRPVLSYGILGLFPQESFSFNVCDGGFRVNSSNVVWPPERSHTNIFLFGGSTAMGFGVPDNATIPAQLESSLTSLGLHCRVYNFSFGSYTLRQEFLRLLELSDRGISPDLAIFLDGLNDSVYAFGNFKLTETLNELYQCEKRRRRLPYWRAVVDYTRSLYQSKQLPGVADYEPPEFQAECATLTTEESIRHALAHTHLPTTPRMLTPFYETIARRVLESYCTSRDLILQLAARKGFQTLFVWQPVPFFAVETRQKLLPKLHFVYPYDILSGAVYRWLDAQEFRPLFELFDDVTAHLNLAYLARETQEPVYLDSCHYTPQFSRRIAHRIAERVIAMHAPVGGKRSSTAVGSPHIKY